MNDRVVTAKLVVDGADEAIAFYTTVLGARQDMRFTYRGAVVFATLALPGGGQLQLKDADEVDPAPPEGGGGVILDVVTDDPDAMMAQAVEHGAEVVFEVADQPYGPRQGRFRDPFGHQWIVGTPISMSPEQIQESLDSM